MLQNADILSLVVSVMSLILTSMMHTFARDPKFNSNLRRILLVLSSFVIILTSYLLSVKIYKIFNGTSLTYYDNFLRVFSYGALLYNALRVLSVVSKPECYYNSEQADKDFATLKTMTLFSIVIGIISLGISIFLIYKDDGEDGIVKKLVNKTTGNVIKDVRKRSKRASKNASKTTKRLRKKYSKYV